MALAPVVKAANDAYSPDAAGNFSTGFTLGTTTPTAGGNASPASGDSLFFGTQTTGTTTLNDDLAAGFIFGGLTFNSGASAFTIAGNSFTLASGGTIANNSTALQTINNNISFGTGTTAASITTVTGGGNFVFGGALTGSAPVNLTGAGTVTLSGTSTNTTGLVTVNAGTTLILSHGVVGTLTTATTRNAIGGGGLTIAGGTVQIGLTATNGGNYQINSTAIPTINSGTLDLNGSAQNLAGVASVNTTGIVTSTSATATTLTIGNSNGTNASYAGIIQDGGGVALAVQKANTNTQTLTGASTYTGSTAIAGGTLAVSSLNSVTTNGTLGTTHSASSSLGAPTTTTNGTIGIGTGTAAGQLTYIGAGETTDRVIKMGGTTGGTTLDQSGTGALKFTSNFTATGAGIKTLTLQGSTVGTGEIAGIIPNNSATNTTSVTKAGTGTWTLSGATTYTGTTSITGGTLNLAKAGTTVGTGGTLTAASPISVTAGTLSLNANDTIGTANTVGLGGGILNLANGTLTGRGAAVAGGTATGTSTTGVGMLTLTANSTLSFAGASGTIVFSGFDPSASNFKLAVTGSNFGTATNSADSTNDRLIFGTALTQAQLNDITFNGAAGATEVQLGTTSFYEVIAPVPEPSTWVTGLLSFGLLGCSLRRRLGLANG